MSNGETNEASGKRVTLTKIVAYGFGILFILTGIAGTIQGPGGVIILLGGVFALPIVRRRITDRTGVSFSRTVVVVIVVVSVMLGGAILPSPDNSSQAGAGDGSQAGDSSQQSASAETQTPQPLTHEIGEPFTVGTGDHSIEYRVDDVFFTERVGSSAVVEEAEGIYLVAVLDMENIGDDSFDISDRHLRAVDEQDREFEADFDATASTEYDPRIDAEGIVNEQLNPGLTVTRAVVFDVNPGTEYQLKIEPAGVFSSADAHYVPAGNADLESE